jgi:hypothetical protein
MAKIFFIPFFAAEGNDEEQGEAQQWATVRGGYRFCCYRGGKIAGIKNAGLFDEIYVVGHRAPGDPTIDSNSGVSLRYDVVGNRLIASGLRPAYSGCIKTYACHEGEATDTNLSFAKRFARYVSIRRSSSAVAYGYTGSLDAEYSTGLRKRG